MGTVWLTSDPHFSHPLVTAERGFTDPFEHDAWLIDKWRATLGKDDVLWVLGDLTIGAVDHSLALMASLPGSKFLVAGNHDPVHPMHRQHAKHLSKWLTVFESVQPFARKTVGKQEVVFSHFPYADAGDGPNREGPGRCLQWRVPDVGNRLVHGHTHDKGQVSEDGRMLHAGVDAWDGELVPWDAVVQWVCNG